MSKIKNGLAYVLTFFSIISEGLGGVLAYKSSHLVRNTTVLSNFILDWSFRLRRIANLQLDLYDWGHLFIKVIMATTQGLSVLQF